VTTKWPDIVSPEISSNATDLYFAGSFESQSIFCNESGADICYIRCIDESSCSLTLVEPMEGTELYIECGQRLSCNEMEVHLNQSTVETVQIICNESSSCRSATVTVFQWEPIRLTLFCLNSLSCHDVTVNLAVMAETDHKLTVDVLCFSYNSCNGLTIDTDDSPNVALSLNVTRFSEEMSIRHVYWEDVGVHCGSNTDRRYIRYETDGLMTDGELLEIAREEYSGEGYRMPCEEISILCSEDGGFEKQCVFDYTPNADLLSIFEDGNAPNCYWLDLDDVFEVQCVGTCDPVVHHNHSVSFHFDIDFVGGSEDNSSNVTTSYALCDEYFGTINDTKSSIENIDVLLDSVLDLLTDSAPSIHRVSVGSQTALRGQNSVHCINDDSNVIALASSLSVEYAEQNKAEILRVFAQNGPFVNMSQQLLSDFFRVPVYVTIEEKNVIDVLEGFTTFHIALIGGAGVLCLGIVGGWLDRRQREKKTVYFKNVMELEDVDTAQERSGALQDVTESTDEEEAKQSTNDEAGHSTGTQQGTLIHDPDFVNVTRPPRKHCD